MRSWELKVNGIIHAGDAEAEQLERKLATELHAVISKAEYGAHFSQLGTVSVHGPVHIPQTPTESPAPAPAPAPAAPIVQPDAASAAAPAAGPISEVPPGFPFTADQLNGALAMLQQTGLITPAPAAAPAAETPEEVPAHLQ